jgi:hypothetical protein
VHDLPDKVRWLDEALDQIPADLTADNDGATHRDIVDSYLRPQLKRCRATSRSRFWTWLRLQLAKSEDLSKYLLWCRESKCPLEVVTPTEGFQYSVNGGVALIDVGSPEHPAVWRVPANRLPWALGLYPVRLKQLPSVESPASRDIRLLQRRLARDGWRLTPEQKDALILKIHEAELTRLQEFTPVVRHQLVKYYGTEEYLVHRLFLDAERDDEVQARNDDFLDFTDVKITIKIESVVSDGHTVRRGDRPLSTTQEFLLPNLYIADSENEYRTFTAQEPVIERTRPLTQEEFEDGMDQRRAKHDRQEAMSVEQSVPVPEKATGVPIHSDKIGESEGRAHLLKNRPGCRK